MSNTTTIGKLLLKHSVPKDLHAFVSTNELDKKNIGSLFSTLAEKHPEQYEDTASKLTRLGFEVSTRMGSTIRLSDLLPLEDKKERYAVLDKHIADIHKSAKNKKDADEKINDAYSKFSDQINKDLVEIGIKQNKTLAKVVKAGARGTPTQYRQTVFAPIVVNDVKGQILTDFPIRKSFAEGLTLPEYLAHTFGARQGAVATKLAVADAGYFSKQLARAAMTIQVEEHDCGTDNGIEVPVTDKDSIGCYLARPIGGYNRNNEVSGKMLNDLANKGVKELLVRSPITCQSSRKFHSGAVCQLCVGRREKGGLAPVGDYVGITASTALGEPLSQGQLNTKHESGSAHKKSVSVGFKLINELANIPSHFQNKAPLAQHDGVVSDIRKAPQGGHYVHIKHGKSENEYYIPEGFEIKVHMHQEIEAGDVISEGIVNPAEVVQHKGIGEGRKYFAETMKRAFDDGGLGGVNRRNFELIAKNAIDHVKITSNDGLGDYLPGQIVSYQAIEKDYQPRPGAVIARIDQSRGKYLEKPELHYSIGTRVTKSMIENLKKHSVEHITVHEKATDFEPEMQRLLDIPIHEHDWMHQLYSTHLEKRLIHAVNTGARSNLNGSSPIPGLAYGVGFGEQREKKSEEDIEEKLSFE